MARSALPASAEDPSEVQSRPPGSAGAVSPAPVDAAPARRNPGAQRGARGAAESPAELRAWLDAVAAIARAVNQARPLRELLDLIAGTACRLMGYDFCAIFLAESEHERLLIEGSHGLSPGYVTEVNTACPVLLRHGPLGEGPSSRAFRSRAPVQVLDTRSDPSFGPWTGVAFQQGYRSMLSVPLVGQGGTLGVLNCYTAAVHRFSAREVALLETIADQAAIAIEAAALHARERATIAHLEELNRSLEAQRALLERAEQIHRELMAVALEDQGLGAIASTLARLLERAIVIEDQQGRPLSTAAPDHAPEPPRVAPRARLAAAAAPDGAGAVVEVAADADGEAAAVVAVLLGAEPVGRIWAVGARGPLGPLERRALEHGAIVVALELLRQRTAQDVEWRLRGDLLEDLLSGAHDDEEVLLARAAHLGHDLARPHTLLVVAADPDPRQGDSVQLRRRLLALAQACAGRAAPRALVASRGPHAVVLWPGRPAGAQPAAQAVAETICREAPRHLGGLTVSVALGQTCQRPAELPGSYRAAARALELAHHLGSRARVVSLDQLGVYRLLLQVERPRELAEFADGLLGPLEARDRRRGGQLVETLRAYLAHGCSPGASAAALAIHPNTLAHRLRRVEELCRLDLRQPEALLRLTLALLVRDVLSPA